jgi:hypothetical protein
METMKKPSLRKSKSAVFDFLHFQSLTAIENAGPSLAHPESALNRSLNTQLIGLYPHFFRKRGLI